MTKDEVIEQLLSALEAAKDHLEWCGYGDSYERDCAREAGLPGKIDSAIDNAKKSKS